MLLKTFVQASSNVVALNRILVVVICILAVMSIFNYRLALTFKDEQKTHLLTPGMMSEDAYVVTGKTANKKYLVQMARYSMGLFLNYTPTSIASQFEELVRIYSPRSYEVERSALMDLKQRVERSLRITSTFVIEDVIMEKDGSLLIKGQRTRFNKTKVTQSLEERYKLEYEIVNGRFFIKKIRKEK